MAAISPMKPLEGTYVHSPKRVGPMWLSDRSVDSLYLLPERRFVRVFFYRFYELSASFGVWVDRGNHVDVRGLARTGFTDALQPGWENLREYEIVYEVVRDDDGAPLALLHRSQSEQFGELVTAYAFKGRDYFQDDRRPEDPGTTTPDAWNAMHPARREDLLSWAVRVLRPLGSDPDSALDYAARQMKHLEELFRQQDADQT